MTESPQHQGSQEGEDPDLESVVKSSSDQVTDWGSASPSGGLSHGRAASLEVASVQVVGSPLAGQDSCLSSRGLTQDTDAPVLEAVDAAICQGLPLPSLETSQPLHVHVGRGKVQAAGSRRGKKITLRPGLVPQEDRGDHPPPKEPFSGEPSEEVKEEGGRIRTAVFPLTQRFAPILPAVPLRGSVSDGVYCVSGTAGLIRVDSQLYEQMEAFFSTPSRS